MRYPFALGKDKTPKSKSFAIKVAEDFIKTYREAESKEKSFHLCVENDKWIIIPDRLKHKMKGRFIQEFEL